MITAHHLVFGRKYLKLNFSINSIQQELIYNGILNPALNRHGSPNALEFVQGYITTSNALPSTDIWSFSFWVKSTKTTTSVINLMGTMTSTGNVMMLYSDAATNKFQVNVRTSEGNNVKYANNVIINDGTWKHIVVVLNRNLDALNEISIYINAVKQVLTTQAPHNSNMTSNFSNLPINFGRNPPNSNYFVGFMSDIKLFTTALTQTEITNLYNE